MYTLRLTQFNTGIAGRYRVAVALRSGDSGQPPWLTTADFPFEMTEQDQKNLRWYLEDYLQYPLDPEPIRAARLEARLAELGEELSRDVFDTDEARDLWAVLRRQLNQTRIEVAVEDVRQATAVPWELLRDPHTKDFLALRAASFVRAYARPV